MSKTTTKDTMQTMLKKYKNEKGWSPKIGSSSPQEARKRGMRKRK